MSGDSLWDSGNPSSLWSASGPTFALTPFSFAEALESVRRSEAERMARHFSPEAIESRKTWGQILHAYESQTIQLSTSAVSAAYCGLAGGQVIVSPRCYDELAEAFKALGLEMA